MYLSKLVFNPQNHLTYRALGDAHALHQRIMQGFPSNPDCDTPRASWNILYRQEPDIYTVLVQSDTEPEWGQLPQQLLVRRECKPVHLESVNFQDRKFRFRLKANPSKRDRNTGKTVSFVRREEQLTWLAQQAEKKGFDVLDVDVVPTANVYGVKEKGKEPIRFQTVLLQGVLLVKDHEQFLQTMRQGVGRGRAYGCGLLSLASLN